MGLPAHQLVPPPNALGGQLMALAGSLDYYFSSDSNGISTAAYESTEESFSDVCHFEDLNFSELKNMSGGFKCPLCSMESRDKGVFRRHYRVHSGEKPYACPYCPYRGKQKSTLNSHIAAQHRELAAK